MISFETDRLICESDLRIEKGKLTEPQAKSIIDIVNLKPATGKESGFMFYTKETQTTLVCHIGVIYTRG